MADLRGHIRYTMYLLAFVIVSAKPGDLYAFTSSQEVNRANKLFADEKYDEAIERYNKVLEKKPESDVMNFNAGSAYYKKSDFEKADKLLSKSLLTDDEELEQKAYYNMGNNKYRQAEAIESTDLEGAIPKYKEALGYYKRAIDLDEEDEDAKFNYEFVKRKLKELQQKKKKEDRKKEKKREDKGEEGKEGEEDRQDQQEQEKDKGKEGEDKGEKGKEGEEDQQDQQEQEKDKGGEGDKRQIPREQVAGEGQMTEKEAKMLLEGFRQEEESKGDALLLQRKGQVSDVIKDW